MVDAKKAASSNKSKAEKKAKEPPKEETPENKPDTAKEAKPGNETGAEAKPSKGADKPALDDKQPKAKAEKPKAEPDTSPAASSIPAVSFAKKPQKRRSVFLPMLLGGVIAAGIGFGAASYYFMTQPTKYAATLDQLQAGLTAQKAQLKTANGKIASLSEAIAQIKADNTAMQAIEALKGSGSQTHSQIEAHIAGLSDQITALNGRLSTLEKRPIADAGAMTQQAAEAYERELQQLRQQITTQRRDIENFAAATTQKINKAAQQAQKLEQSADAKARAAARQAAVAQLQSALDSGAAFQAQLSHLAAHSDAGIPPVLSEVAQSGVPTLSALQAKFPAAARAAFAASAKATAGDGVMDRVGSFFQSQVGGRSLKPREGDDPDAVLSRAEAALGAGDVDAAIALIHALPEAGQAAMSGWLKLAQQRSASVKAITELANGLNGN